MKIKVRLNQMSIQNAIKKLNAVEHKLPLMRTEMLNIVGRWIIDKANQYVDNSYIGDDVKEQIKSGWKPQPYGNGIKLVNSNRYAVFVEFGVGKVGETNPHPNANDEGYEYNVPSRYKYAGQYHTEYTWRFIVDSEDEVDLAQGSYEAWNKADGTLKIITEGSFGVLFAYNAVVDAHNDLQNPSGKLQKEWRKIKERYIG